MGLSGGQKQRVAVASAIASGRPLILFDEPTSGLDLFHMRQVANVVNQVANAGRTALVVTHDPEFILRCCNYVLHLENGQIQESYSIAVSYTHLPSHRSTRQRYRIFYGLWKMIFQMLK